MKIKEEIVREEIILKAQELFRQFGLKKTTMDEIAAACGKAKSTLYHYYKSKDEVFEAVVFREMTNLRIVVKKEVDKQASLKDKITSYIMMFHQEVANKLNVYRILKQEKTLDTIYMNYFNTIMAFERDYISRLLFDAYDTGEFTDFEKEDILWFSEAIIAAFLGIVKYTIEREEEISIDKLRNAATTLIPKIFG